MSAGYTLVNLLEVEDMALRHGLAPGLQSRFARTALGLERSGLSHFRLAPGFRMPFGHSHREQEEVYLLVGGGACLKLDGEVIELRPWDAVRIAAPTVRALEGGPEGAEVIAFSAPQTEDMDAEMIPGWWTD